MADGGGWITKYGVPSLILSVAAFAFQQQQQVFDRRQANVEGGYQFYSAQRTRLLYADDVETELSLLRIVGRAFPSIYCDVREDLYNRAWEAQDRTGLTDTSGREPISGADISLLQGAVADPDLARPAESQYPRNLMENFTAHRRTCDDLNQRAQQADESAGATPVDAVTDAPAADSAPASGAIASRAEQRSAPALAQTPSATPSVAQAPTMVRVFLHIPVGSAREASIRELADTARTELASSNYRVMRGIERIAPSNFPREPEVRYFGPAQADEARALAEYLNYQYRSEGLQFRTLAIGESYPDMPPENIEVWIPNAH